MRACDSLSISPSPPQWLKEIEKEDKKMLTGNEPNLLHRKCAFVGGWVCAILYNAGAVFVVYSVHLYGVYYYNC